MRRQRLLTAGASLLIALGIAWTLVGSRPLLYDNDSYYHLAIAQRYYESGPTDQLETLRASTLADGFGDKEVLYHLALAPLVRAFGPIVAGRIALVTTLALLAAMVTFLAYPVLGAWSIVLPLFVPYASTEMAWRLVRLRPESLSLLMILIALWLAASGRFRWLAPLAFVYTLSYTAFHALLGLLGLPFLFWGVVRKRWTPGLLIYPTLGCGFGLIVHPHFPKNLEIWILQSFDFFRNKGELDVGTEILPNITDVTLMANLGLIFGLILLWCSSVADEREASPERSLLAQRLADAFSLAALIFLVLYLLMSRFSLYAMPLVTLALVFEIGRRGGRLGRFTRLPFQAPIARPDAAGRAIPIRIPALLSLGLVLLVSLPDAQRQLETFRQRTDAGPDGARIHDREQLSQLLPEGARVAARWQQTPIYMLWAPQARYLNVLDPVFQAVRFPELYAAQRELFAGQSPDSPLVALAQTDSEYLAYSAVGAGRFLTRRLEHDPRVERLHAGSNLLYRILPDRNQSFVLDWHIVPGGLALPPVEASELDRWPSYPRASAWARVEGFVDGNRIANDEPCIALARPLGKDAAGLYELSPWGPTQLWLGERTLVRTNGSNGAILGEGLMVRVETDDAPVLEAARDETGETAASNRETEPLMTVLTCASGPVGRRGFYLRRLEG